LSAVARRLAGNLPRAQALGAQARVDACRLDWSHIVDAVEAEYVAAMHGMHESARPGWQTPVPAA